MNINLDQFYSDIAYYKDDFQGGPTYEAIKANQSVVDYAVTQALDRAFLNVSNVRFSEVEVSYTTDNGIALKLTRTYSARCCEVGRDTYTLEFTWEELLMDGGFSELVNERWDAEKASTLAVKEKKAQAERALELQNREVAERAQYELLKAKYEGQS